MPWTCVCIVWIVGSHVYEKTWLRYRAQACECSDYAPTGAVCVGHGMVRPHEKSHVGYGQAGAP